MMQVVSALLRLLWGFLLPFGQEMWHNLVTLRYLALLNDPGKDSDSSLKRRKSESLFLSTVRNG
jgi:hypothetical protein